MQCLNHFSLKTWFKKKTILHTLTHIHFKSSLIHMHVWGFTSHNNVSISSKPHKTCASNIQDSLCTTQTVFVRKKVLHDPFLLAIRIFPMTHDPQLLQKLSPPTTQLKSKMFHRSPGIASSSFKVDVSQADYETTVDGKNPANQLMVSLSHYLQGVFTSSGGGGFLPSTVLCS